MVFGSADTAWLFEITTIFLMAVVLVVEVRRARHLRSKVVAAAGRVCIHCSYTLADLPAPGICPECGREYPEDGHAAAWLRAWPQILGKCSNLK